MLKIHYKLKKAILLLVDWFYPPFKQLFPLQTFRYAVCGGANMLLGVLLMAFFYNVVFHKVIFHLFSIAISPYIAALLATFCFTLPIGFYLSMFVVFPGSPLRRRVQFARYFLIVLCNIFLNYFLLKLFVEVFHWYPTPSYMLNVLIVVTFTYFSQRYFSFSQKNKK